MPFAEAASQEELPYKTMPRRPRYNLTGLLLQVIQWSNRGRRAWFRLFFSGISFVVLLLAAFDLAIADSTPPSALPGTTTWQSTIVQTEGIPPDPAANGYIVAPGERRLKKKLILEGHVLVTDYGLTWMDKHRFIANYVSDKHETFDPSAGTGKNFRILIVNVDTGEVTKVPHEGYLACYRDGRIAVFRSLYQPYFSTASSRTDQFISVGRELSLGNLGEALKIPIPNGEPKDQTINKETCRLEPKDPVAELRRQNKKHLGGMVFTTEQATPLAGSNADMGRFDKSKPFFQNMSVTNKQKWVWHGPDGREKIIETNVGEIADTPVHVPFEGGAHFYPVRLDSTLPSPDFNPKFNRLVYPDGKVMRLPVPDLLWNEYVNSFGRAGLGIWYTKAGVIWGKGGKKDSPMPRGLYLEDRAKKQLVKLESFRISSSTLFPDGCRMLTERIAEHGGFWDYYIIDLCTGE